MRHGTAKSPVASLGVIAASRRTRRATARRIALRRLSRSVRSTVRIELPGPFAAAPRLIVFSDIETRWCGRRARVGECRHRSERRIRRRDEDQCGGGRSPREPPEPPGEALLRVAVVRHHVKDDRSRGRARRGDISGPRVQVEEADLLALSDRPGLKGILSRSQYSQRLGLRLGQ